MTNTFKSLQAEVGLTPVTVSPAAGATTVVIGMRFGNKTTGDVSVHADLVRGGTKTRVVGTNTPIPAGSALEGAQGSKIVMEDGDVLEIAGNADACADLTLSIMEMTP